MEGLNGILPVWKPTGGTTYDIIRVFKREAGFHGKIGHAGPLDPFATGVVLLLLGDATKKFDEIQAWTKVYVAEARLGQSSTTLDPEGEITQVKEPAQKPTKQQIEEVARTYIGRTTQKVPAFSAAKHKGKPLYKHAREGKIIEKEKEIDVERIRIIAYEYPLAVLEVEAHSGTYIRQLSYDIFEKLGVESFLSALLRTKVGDIDRSRCATISEIQEGTWRRHLIT